MGRARWGFLILAIFVSAFFFYRLWPMPDQKLDITQQRLERLQQLKPELNFNSDPRTFYRGDPNPVERAAGNLAFANMVDTLVADLPSHPSKQFVLEQFKFALAPMSEGDTEDRERAALYCEKVMDVLGIESSDGLLNEWMYGLILGHELERHKKHD